MMRYIDGGKILHTGEKKRLNQTDLVFEIQYHNRKKG